MFPREMKHRYAITSRVGDSLFRRTYFAEGKELASVGDRESISESFT